jgi:hypothetical protein
MSFGLVRPVTLKMLAFGLQLFAMRNQFDEDKPTPVTCTSQARPSWQDRSPTKGPLITNSSSKVTLVTHDEGENGTDALCDSLPCQQSVYTPAKPAIGCPSW